MGGDVPTQKYMAGAVLGGLLSAVIGGLGITVGLGFYLPFNIVLTYSLGTLSRELVDRYKGKSFSENVGIPIAAGLIVGEARHVGSVGGAELEPDALPEADTETEVGTGGGHQAPPAPPHATRALPSGGHRHGGGSVPGPP